MSPPILVCPRGPHGPGESCPLWSAAERSRYQRSIEVDAAARLGLSALVLADFNQGVSKPSAPPTRPIPVSPRQPTAELIPAAATHSANPKGVRHA